MFEYDSIPGATPIPDISDLKPKTLHTRKQLDALEAVNNAKALKKYSFASSPKALWKNPNLLKRLHHDMFCDVWKWSGCYRKSTTNIGVKPYLIAQEVGKLCNDISAWELPIIEQAVRIHHRLVWIHPFENGNGRHARLTSDLFLAFHKHPIPKWPTDIAATGSKRMRYIETLKVADLGDIEPLMDYMLELC